MIATISPAKTLKGRVSLPASKSYSIRAFLVAARGGSSVIISPSDCDDANVSKNIAKALGASVVKLRGNQWKVFANKSKPRLNNVNVGESGTVLRLLLPLLPFYSQKAVVNGKGTLRGRPNAHLTRVLRKMGLCIQGKGAGESIPIKFMGGVLKGGKIAIDGSLSSQFISALLISFPSVVNNTQIVIKGKKVVSTDYITMTQQVLKRSGINTKKISPRNFKINGNQKFKGLKKFRVPSDYGLAAFLLAAGALIPSDLILDGAYDKSLIQADGAIIGLLKKIGVRFKQTDRSIKIKGPFKLKGGSFSLKNCPDLVPIMTVLALFASGKTRLYDIGHVRAKESDRISDLRKELIKVGARITEKQNEITIYPQKKYKEGVLLNPHHDHRLAMSFCILGLRLGVKVSDIGCVSKSYSGFLKDLKNIGAKVKKGK